MVTQCWGKNSTLSTKLNSSSNFDFSTRQLKVIILDCCIGLKSVHIFLVVLGVVDMCHFLLKGHFLIKHILVIFLPKTGLRGKGVVVRLPPLPPKFRRACHECIFSLAPPAHLFCSKISMWLLYRHIKLISIQVISFSQKKCSIYHVLHLILI